MTSSWLQIWLLANYIHTFIVQRSAGIWMRSDCDVRSSCCGTAGHLLHDLHGRPSCTLTLSEFQPEMTSCCLVLGRFFNQCILPCHSCSVLVSEASQSRGAPPIPNGPSLGCPLRGSVDALDVTHAWGVHSRSRDPNRSPAGPGVAGVR